MSPVLAGLAVVVGALAVQPRPPHRSIRPAHHAAPGRHARRRRQPSPTPSELAAWCESLARSVRAGDTLHQALRSVSPPKSISATFAEVELALARGASVGSALAGLRQDCRHLDLVLVVLRACARHGGPAGEPLDRAAAALRQRAALIAERRAHSAQARISAKVMTILPGAVLLMLIASSASVRAAVASPPGLLTLAAGSLCNLVGWLWMRRLIGALS